jgi:exodeoxyribonuclease VII small subunit
MENTFDYAKAMAELEEIARTVENPETKLEQLDSLISRSKVLIKACRDYLRGIQEKIDSL